MVTFNFQHMVMLLVLVILLALNKVTLANPEPSAGVGECQDYVPIINDEKCQDGE
jgi:hypothetical protein